MWKVEIKKIHKLYEFTDDFIQELFKWAFTNKGITLDKVQESIKAVKLSSFSNACSSLREHMFKLANCSDIEEVYKMYIEFTNHYESIIKGNFQSGIKLQEQTFKIVKNAFEYFYNEGLDLKSFWESYKTGEYKTKNDYRNEIGAIRHRCPYCDINRTTVADFTNTDHFLPISVYPFLGVFWKNLVVSCVPCNTAIKNKSVMLPILHPFIDRIQDVIYFTFDIKAKTITINSKDNGFGVEATENYYKLFHLDENYPKLWDIVDREERDTIREITRTIKKTRIKKMEEALIEVNEIIDERKNSVYSQRGIAECTKLKVDFYEFYHNYSETKIKKFMLLEHGLDIIKNLGV
jgi:hypothetical protein